MSEIRFQTGFRGDPTGEPGLVLHDDGTVWLVASDGSETQLPGGGGGLPDWVTATSGDSGNQFTIDGNLNVVGDGNGIATPNISVAGSGLAVGPIDEDSGALVGVNGVFTVQGLDTSDQAYMMLATVSGTDVWGLKPLGQEYTAVGLGAPDDDVVNASERVQWYEDTSGSPKQRIKERDVDGTLYNRISAVLTEDATAFAGIAQPLLSASPTVAQISTVLSGLGLTRQT